MTASSDPTPEMLNDPDGRQLVAAIHARRASKTTAAKEAHLMFITTRAEAVRKWMSTDLDEPRNLAGLQRALDAQVGDVDYLIAELRTRDAPTSLRAELVKLATDIEAALAVPIGKTDAESRGFDQACRDTLTRVREILGTTP